MTNDKVVSGISSSKLTGALPAVDGSALTGMGMDIEYLLIGGGGGGGYDQGGGGGGGGGVLSGSIKTLVNTNTSLNITIGNGGHWCL